MTDTVLRTTTKFSPPQRPPLALTRPMDWAAHSPIQAFLNRTRRADGSYPTWVMRSPNVLTSLRVFMLPMVALFNWAALAHQTTWVVTCFIGVLLLMVTDGLDGSMARAIPAKSPWGRRADPFFDKFAGFSLILGWLILAHYFIGVQFAVLFWLVTARIFLDVVLMVITVAEECLRREPRVGAWGKIKAGCDDLAMLAGYGGGIAFTIGTSVRGFTTTAEAMLLVACLLASMSIYQHARNLFRRRTT